MSSDKHRTGADRPIDPVEVSAGAPAPERGAMGEPAYPDAVMAAFHRVYTDFQVRECDRTEADDLDLLEAHGLMRSRILGKREDPSAYGDSLEPGDRRYDWTKAGVALFPPSPERGR